MGCFFVARNVILFEPTKKLVRASEHCLQCRASILLHLFFTYTRQKFYCAKNFLNVGSAFCASLRPI